MRSWFKVSIDKETQIHKQWSEGTDERSKFGKTSDTRTRQGDRVTKELHCPSHHTAPGPVPCSSGPGVHWTGASAPGRGPAHRPGTFLLSPPLKQPQCSFQSPELNRNMRPKAASSGCASSKLPHALCSLQKQLFFFLAQQLVGFKCSYNIIFIYLDNRLLYNQKLKPAGSIIFKMRRF